MAQNSILKHCGMNFVISFYQIQKMETFGQACYLNLEIVSGEFFCYNTLLSWNLNAFGKSKRSKEEIQNLQGLMGKKRI